MGVDDQGTSPSRTHTAATEEGREATTYTKVDSDEHVHWPPFTDRHVDNWSTSNGRTPPLAPWRQSTYELAPEKGKGRGARHFKQA